MGIKQGQLNITAIKAGQTNISKVYRGTNVIYEESSVSETILTVNAAATYTLNLYKEDTELTEIYVDDSTIPIATSTTQGSQDISITITETENTNHTISIKNMGNWYFDNYCLGNTNLNSKLTAVDTSKEYTMTCIGSFAFDWCTNLAGTLTIPNSVISIYNDAFNACKFNNLIIGSGVTSIGNSAFIQCQNLIDIIIPKNVVSIGTTPFSRCYNLASIQVENGNEVYCSINNCLIEIASKTLIVGCNNSIIPSDGSVTSIGNYAFSDFYYLTSISIPSMVTSIGKSAFSNCLGLTDIIINDGLTTINNEAFVNTRAICISIPSSVTTIGYNAFSSCSTLKIIYCAALSKPTGWNSNWNNNCTAEIKWGVVPSVGLSYTLSSGNYSVSGIGTCTDLEIIIPIAYKGKAVTALSTSAFYNQSQLTAVIIPESIVTIGQYAFQKCTGLTTLDIPRTVTSIGSRFISDCPALETLNIYTLNSSSKISSASNAWCYNGNPNTKIHLLMTLNTSALQTAAFGTYFANYKSGSSYKCEVIADLLPAPSSGLTYSLNSDRQSYSVSGIGTCTDTALIMPTEYSNKPITGIKADSFKNNTSITSVRLSSSITKIASNAFYGCTKLQQIYIADNLSTIESSAFQNCSSLNRVDISDLSTWCRIAFSSPQSNPLYYAHNLYLNNSLLTNLIIPSDIVYVLYGAFYNCTSLKQITIGNNVTDISTYAFCGCSAVTQIDLGGSVSIISMEAFKNCSSLLSISIPDSITTIYQSAFEGCTSLTDITFGKNISTLGNYVFRQCSALATITVDPENSTYCDTGNCLISIQNNTLILGCKNSVIPTDGSVTAIGAYAFEYSSGLTELTVPNIITSIGNGAFSNCTNLTTLILPSNIVSIPYSLCLKCSNLTNITIPNTVTSIEQDAFYNCSNLINLVIPDTVNTIGSSALRLGTTTNKSTVTFMSTVPCTIQSNSFYSSSLKNIVVPTGCGDTYKAAANWSSFASYIVEAS